MTVKEILENLRNTNLALTPFQDISMAIRSLGNIPTVEMDVNEGIIIERGRINEEGKYFYSESDISVREAKH